MPNLMLQVKEDMDVFDKNGKRVGSVDVIHLGDEDLSDRDLETSTPQKPPVARQPLVAAITSALSRTDTAPEELRARLERYGFFKVDASIFTTDRYVLATQIAAVDTDEGRVDLTITEDDMIEA